MNEVIKKNANDEVPVLDAEIVDESLEKVPVKAPKWELPYPLTARTLFHLAMRINDPARANMGFFYEARLKQECEFLIRYPVYKNDVFALQQVLDCWNNNPMFFRCSTIGSVLSFYLAASLKAEGKNA